MSSNTQLQGIALSLPQARRSLQARVSWGDHVVTVGGEIVHTGTNRRETERALLRWQRNSQLPFGKAAGKLVELRTAERIEGMRT